MIENGLTTEQWIQLKKNQRELQTKYVYFLLTVDAAAIGYTVTIPKPEDVNVSYLVLTIAILLWGMSFFAGCIYLLGMMGNDSDDVELLNPGITDNDKEKIQRRLENTKKVSAKSAKWMLITILAGFLAFIVWHMANIPYSEIFNC